MSKFLLDYDKDQHSVLEPTHEKLPYHFHKKLLYVFVEKKDIDEFLKKYPHQSIGEFLTISFNPTIYEVEVNGQKFTLCQAPLGAPAAVQLLDWLIGYGVKQVLAVGSAGAISDLPENKMFLVKRALRDEGTSLHYLPASNFIDLETNWRNIVRATLTKLKLDVEDVTTWTTDGFFRETKKKVITAKSLGCELVEMECSAMASCCQFRGVDFSQILFTADSLADIENYDERNWGNDSHSISLEIGSIVLGEIE